MATKNCLTELSTNKILFSYEILGNELSEKTKIESPTIETPQNAIITES